ncbi:MAG: FAD-dependent oxidoreductase [Bryobacteraceae bacterium]|nr:FAD-dependent oxidoreductase [Bryobacteraceae bacterium]
MKPLFAVFALVAATLSAQKAPQQFDLVVYGGTAGGVATAVAGARHGLKTVLLEPGRHIGGMVSGGLSGTDVGKIEVIGGMALEYYWRAGRHYNIDRHLQQVSWMPEPGVAEKLFRDMLDEAKVTLLTGHRLVEKKGVAKQGRRVTEIVMENGARFRGRIFADATYEGDLMAQAGISYSTGREGVAQYNESLAGVRVHTGNHNFPVDVQARDEQGRLLPEISAEPRGEPGSGDKRIQAYNFRVIATNVPENRIPWEKPEGYDVKRYELLARTLTAITKHIGRAPTFNEVSLLRIIPNGKVDLNNRGPFSTDFIGKNYGYPDGTYAEREKIWKEHILYQKGFYYFLANDPRVPESLRNEVSQWGLARDEFTDTGNWPNQLYVREARRMVGDFVASQKDLQTERTKADYIGMGSYNSDSHNVQRHVAENGIVLNEGNVEVPVQPYQIPFRVLLPKRTEAENVLVPVCFSASHVAYSSLRMEPQYMIIGHAAGIAAALALKTSNAAVQDVPVPELQRILAAEGGVFEQSFDNQQKALATIRTKFTRPPVRHPQGRTAFSRAEPK